MNKTKVCTKCRVEKPATTEYFGKLKEGFQCWCKECKTQNYNANKEEISNRRKHKYRMENPLEIIQEGMKKCCVCKEIKPATNMFFNTLKNTKDSFRYECKECRKIEYKKDSERIIEKSRKYYKDNKENVRVKNKDYKKENEQWYREYHKKYYQKNIVSIKKRVQERFYERIEKDIAFKVLQRCRARLYKAIKGNVKSKRTIELIGCEVDFLLQHIEAQFREGMSWRNYGEWHIDHIIPCSTFDFSEAEQQQKCFNYKNLQPLWASENLEKSNRLDWDIESSN